MRFQVSIPDHFLYPDLSHTRHLRIPEMKPTGGHFHELRFT